LHIPDFSVSSLFGRKRQEGWTQVSDGMILC
jgi:hypothetical protein